MRRFGIPVVPGRLAAASAAAEAAHDVAEGFQRHQTTEVRSAPAHTTRNALGYMYAHLARLELAVVPRERRRRIPCLSDPPGTELVERGGQLTLRGLPLEWPARPLGVAGMKHKEDV